MRKREAKKLHDAWREAVIEKGREGERYRCFHCKKPFDRDQICADHWPRTKGNSPHLRYDVDNGQPSCQTCNTSGSRHRKKVPKNSPPSREISRHPHPLL